MPADLSAPLPAVDLSGSATLTVDAGDAAALITKLTIHVAQDTPESLLTPDAASVYLLSTESAGRDPADFGGPGGG